MFARDSLSCVVDWNVDYLVRTHQAPPRDKRVCRLRQRLLLDEVLSTRRNDRPRKVNGWRDTKRNTTGGANARGTEL